MLGYEKPFSAVLDESTESVGKNLARERDRAFCKAVLKHPRLCKTMLYRKLETWCALNVLTSAVEKHHHLSITTKVKPTLVASHGMQ